MKNVSKSKSKFKKQSQIFNLKKILNNVNNESYLLLSKITELQKLFKNTKKIINEKISKKNNNVNTDETQKKHQICEKLNLIISRYNEGNTITSINNKKAEYKRSLLEKTKDLNIILKKLKYKKLQKEKDILNQTIKEKKNICDIFKKQIEYEKDLGSIFQPKNLIFFYNLYYLKNEFLKINFKKGKKKKLYELFNQTSTNLEEIGISSVYELKEEKKNYMKKFNEYIYNKGFNCVFENKRYKERYNIEIELLSNYDYSSDSDYDNEEEESNNRISFFNKNINENNVNNLKNNNIKKNNMLKTKKKKMSLSSSEKETNDQEKEIKNNDNYILVNKLVGLKEKYNKLINEKYDLDYQKKILQKKISNIKNKIVNTTITTTTLSIKSTNHKSENKKKSYFFNKY